MIAWCLFQIWYSFVHSTFEYYLWKKADLWQYSNNMPPFLVQWLLSSLSVLYTVHLRFTDIVDVQMERYEQQRGADAAGGDHMRNEQECPICISVPRFAVKTNCGHLFCGKCVL